MNHSATTSTESARNSDVSADTGTEVIRLICPSCNGGLNLQRRHIGIDGSCVHCHSPIRAAVRPNGEVFAEIPINEVKTENVESAVPRTPATEAAPSSFSQIGPKETSNSAPPSLDTHPPEKRFEPRSEDHASTPASHFPKNEGDSNSGNSPWGFPKPVSNQTAFQEPPTVAAEPVVPSPGSNRAEPPDNSAFETTDPPPLDQVDPIIPETAKTPFLPKKDTAFGMPLDVEPGTGNEVESPSPDDTKEIPSFGLPQQATHQIQVEPPATPAAVVEGSEKPGRKNVPPLFAQTSENSGASSIFGEQDEEDIESMVASNPTGDPVSPFPPENRGTEPAPGFAEALFPKKETALEPQLPPAQVGSPSKTPLPQTPPLFDSPGATVAEVVPPPETTTPPKVSKPSRVFKEGSASETAAAITKFMRLMIVLTLLGGFCYTAFILTPPEKVGAMKVQIKEWLKPGAVLKEYLPFEVSIWEEKPPAPAPESDSKTDSDRTEIQSSVPVKSPLASTEEKPENQIPATTPDPTIRPAPAVTPDQIASDTDPPE